MVGDCLMGLLKLINEPFSIKCYKTPIFIQISYQQQPKTCFYNLLGAKYMPLWQSSTSRPVQAKGPMQ